MDKQQQIQEMAYLLHQSEHELTKDFDCDGDCANCWCSSKKRAEALYDKGYRKVITEKKKMEETELTDDEIVTAYKHCVLDKGDCDDCPYDDWGCGIDGNDLIEIIHRLQGTMAEYERKLEDGELVSKDWHDEQVLHAENVIEEQKAEIKRLKNAYREGLEQGKFDSQQEIERFTEELKNLDWYKMWHGKFKKEIDDLTLELETYRPTKLHGNGQCKCSNCGNVSWTDFGFSRYKGKTLCDKCLKEIIAKEKPQAVKDTAKEIWNDITSYYFSLRVLGNATVELDKLAGFWHKRGVEVE